MRDWTQLKNAANVRLGRTTYDFYRNAESAYTLDPERDYDIDFEEFEPEELELHYGREFARRYRRRPRRARYGTNVRNRRGYEPVFEDWYDYEDMYNEFDADHDEYESRPRLMRLRRPMPDFENDERRRNFFRRRRRGERTTANWPWSRSDLYGPLPRR